MSTRRLSAIMFSDIAGYTAMMQIDEKAGKIKAETYRKLLEEAASHFNGKVIQHYGDGSLSIFPSSVEAIRCAKQVQLSVQNHKIPLRIGVHLGDIAIDGNDVYGDGVNVASRVESIGEPGTILFTKRILTDLETHPEFEYTSLGEFAFKNVKRPLDVYALKVEGYSIPVEKLLSKKQHVNSRENHSLKASNKHWLVILLASILVSYLIWGIQSPHHEKVEKSIAVLPFEDLSPDRDHAYFSDGLMEEILNHLIKIEDLRVISRTSAMRYKDSPKLITEVARELDVANILTGSVRKDGNQVKIRIELSDAISDESIWSESYVNEMSNIFEVQSNIATSIAEKLRAQVPPDIQYKLSESPTQNLEAYNLFLQARHILWYNVKLLDVAQLKLEESIKLDPDFAAAYALLARLWMNKGLGIGGFEADPSTIREVVPPLLDAALQLDNDDFNTNIYMANYLWWYNWDFTEAEKYFERALRVYSPGRGSIPSYTVFNVVTGNLTKAIEYAEQFLGHNPHALSSFVGSGFAYCWGGQPEKAVEVSERTLDQFGTNAWIISNVTYTFICAGQYQRVIDLLSSLTLNRQDLNNSHLAALAIAFNHTNQKEEAVKCLELLLHKSESSDSGSPSYFLALVFADRGQVETAFELLEKGFQKREPLMFWLKIQSLFEPLHADPRWQEMLDRIGYPD